MFPSRSRLGAAHDGAPRSLTRTIALAAATLLLGALGSVLAVAPAMAAGDANEASCPTSTESSPGFRSYLPDCRAYELVTPSYKQAAAVKLVEYIEGEGGIVTEPSESPAGMSVLGATNGGGLAGTENTQSYGGATAFYKLLRTDAGWAPAAISPPASSPLGSNWHIIQASSDQAATVWSVEGKNGVAVLYRREANGSIVPIGPVSPESAGETFNNEDYGGIRLGQSASSDLSHIVFGLDNMHLWPFDATLPAGNRVRQQDSLYEFVGSANAHPILVGVSGGAESTALISTCGTSLGGLDGNEYHAMSANGETIFFTPTPASLYNCAGTGGVAPAHSEVYARVGQSRTVDISEPSPNRQCTSTECEAAAATDALYEGASTDGSRVVFTSLQQLTNAATNDPTGGECLRYRRTRCIEYAATATSGGGCTKTVGTGCNLYEYDFAKPEGDRLLLLSGGASSGTGPQVQGVVDIAANGSRVYFVAKGVLTGVGNEFGEVAAAGAENLYSFDSEGEARPQFVTDLCSGPGMSGSVADSRCHGSDVNLWAPLRASSTYGTYGSAVGRLATPQGQYLLFPSNGDVTPDDRSSVEQLFQYDSATRTLRRVSIGRQSSEGYLCAETEVEEGFKCNGNVPVPSLQPLSGNSEPTFAQSADGAYVFFTSEAALTPQALEHATVNGGGTAENIYEYHDGQVALISDGQDVSGGGGGESAVRLLGIDPTGHDVFFQTNNPLVPQDTNTSADIYDARVDGGFPTPPPALKCIAETCRGSGTIEPGIADALSAGQLPGGNLASSSLTKPKRGKHRRAKRYRRKLRRALRRCRHRFRHNRHRRRMCKRRARRRYRRPAEASRHGQHGGRYAHHHGTHKRGGRGGK